MPAEPRRKNKPSPRAFTAGGARSTSWPRRAVPFAFFDASTHQAIAGFDPIPDNAVIDTSRSLAIRAYTSPATVGSVTFALDGSAFHTENASPYCINGDNGASCYSWPVPSGAHTLVATPFSASQGGGQAGAALTIHFTTSASTAEHK